MEADFRVDSIFVDEELGEMFAKCYDNVYGEEFEKFLGSPDTEEGRQNALTILEDGTYTMTDELRNEFISTFGLDDFGQEIIEVEEEDEFYDDSEDEVVESFSIREALNKIDLYNDNKYDLLNLYESCTLNESEKRELGKLLYDQADSSVIYDTLNKKYISEHYDDCPELYDELFGKFEEMDGVLKRTLNLSDDEIDMDHIGGTVDTLEDYVDDCKSLADDIRDNRDLDEDLDKETLKSKLEKATREFVTNTLGYDDDFVDDYIFVEVKEDKFSDGSEAIKCEIRTELDYEECVDLSTHLNPILFAEDKDAYFDMEDAHTLSAYIRTDFSDDVVDEETVSEYADLIKDISSMEELRKLYKDIRDLFEDRWTSATFAKVHDLIMDKADEINNKNESKSIKENIDNETENKLLGQCDCCGIDIYSNEPYALICGQYLCDYCGGENGMSLSDMEEDDIDESVIHEDTTDRPVEFKAGYYEWNVLVDGEIIYSFGDFGETLEGCTDKDTLGYEVEDCIQVMLDELNESGKNIQLTKGEFDALKNQMVAKLGYHYLDLDESKSIHEDTNKSLASRLVDFYKDYDYYDYMDILEVDETDEDATKDMESRLGNNKYTNDLLDKLNDISKEELDNEQKEIVNSLIIDVKKLLGDRELKEDYEADAMTFAQWFDETQRYGDDEEFYPFENYIKKFPNAEILRNATAEDIRDNAHRFYDLYDVDSVDREKAFHFASELLGLDYDVFYDAWLSGSPIPGTNLEESQSIRESTPEKDEIDTKEIEDELLWRGMRGEYGYYEDTVAFKMTDKAKAMGMNHDDAYKLAWDVVAQMHDKRFEFIEGEDLEESKSIKENMNWTNGEEEYEIDSTLANAPINSIIFIKKSYGGKNRTLKFEKVSTDKWDSLNKFNDKTGSYESDKSLKDKYIDGATWKLEKSVNESKSINESDEETPYTKEEVERDLKSITHNFTDKSGELKCGFEEEKNFGVEILKQHYKVVEVSGDDRRDGTWYHISFANPIEDKSIEERNEVLEEDNENNAAPRKRRRIVYDETMLDDFVDELDKVLMPLSNEDALMDLMDRPGEGNANVEKEYFLQYIDEELNNDFEISFNSTTGSRHNIYYIDKKSGEIQHCGFLIIRENVTRGLTIYVTDYDGTQVSPRYNLQPESGSIRGYFTVCRGSFFKDKKFILDGKITSDKDYNV